jgi:hypothetical protein
LLATSLVILFTSGIGKNYGGREDILERMYSEVLDRNPSLKQLEKELEENEEQHAILRSKFETYHQQSTLYYGAADQKIKGIRDTTLTRRMRSLVSQSEEGYRQRTAELNRLRAQLSQKSISIEDYHLAVKIITTLPEIESYQKEKLPASQEYVALLRKMEASLQKLTEKTK